MNRFSLLILLAIIAVVSSCTKPDPTIIEDNRPPYDGTLNPVLVENYVNKAYISLLGRKPDAQEEEAALQILFDGDLSQASREQMIDGITGDSDWTRQLYDQQLAKLLGTADTSEIVNQIFAIDLLLANPIYEPFWPQLEAERIRWTELRRAWNDLSNGTITAVGYHRRLVNNGAYDDINMGTENFVTSVFENFFFRYPTESELQQSSQMVDGFSGLVFNEVGGTKDEFLNIFFGSQDYFEGQVRDYYLRYLFKEPETEFTASLASDYRNTLDLRTMQKAILTTDEYIGL